MSSRAQELHSDVIYLFSLPKHPFFIYLVLLKYYTVTYKSLIDIKPLSLTLHSVNVSFIHHPSNIKNYSIGHKSETGQPKKKVHPSHIFLHLKFLAQNTKHPLLQKFWNFFSIWAIAT